MPKASFSAAQDEHLLLLPVSAKTLTTLHRDNRQQLSKVRRGIASQIISASACFGGWSDTEFFRTFGLDFSKVAGATSLIRLLFRNCLTSGSSNGFFLSEAIGEQDAERIQHIVIAGYTQALIVTALSSLGYLSSHLFVRLLLSSQKAIDATNLYTDIGLLGNLPVVFLTPMTLIALQTGSWKMPILANLIFRFAIPALSYLFIHICSMQDRGIDWANVVAPWLGFFMLGAYMHFNETFRDVRQWSWKDVCEGNKKELSRQLIKSLQMMSLRATEYLNLGILGGALDRINENYNYILNPFLQISPFCTLAALGAGTIANQDAREKRAMMLKILKNIEENHDVTDSEKARECYQDIREVILKTLLVGTIINFMFTLVLILAKNPLINLFISKEASADDRSAAADILMVNAFGLIPDAWRIIASSILTTYDHPVRPNMVALLLMTLIAIPAGAASAYWFKKDYAIMMCFFRNAMILLTSAINVRSLYRCFSEDGVRLNRALHPGGNQTVGIQVPLNEREDVQTASFFQRWTKHAEPPLVVVGLTR